MIINAGRRQMAGPLDRERDADASFEKIEMRAPEWKISTWASWRPVVAQEKDQRVIKEVLRLERLQHLPDTIVHCNDHSRVST